MPLIRSISGLRGTVPDSLTPDIVARYARAFARYAGSGGPIIIGRDGRPSGDEFALVAAKAITDEGVKVKMIGIVPTPTVQLETEHSDAVGGISITASHNPSEWNGMKFLGPDGVFLDEEENKKFWKFVDNPRSEESSGNHGAIIQDAGAIGRHIDAVRKLELVSRQDVRERKLRIAVDAVNAAGSKIVPELLDDFGVDVVPVACDSSGNFPHTPEPIPENLGMLCDAVKNKNCDMGIAVDPDSDRLVLITEEGIPFGEEYTVTCAVDFILSKRSPRHRGDVAVNLSTTRAVDDVAKKYGVRVHRSAVGEINVVKLMKEKKCVVGGEGSGGVIVPALHFGRDAMIGVVTILGLLAERKLSARELRASMPQYEIVKKKFDASTIDVARALAHVAKSFEGKASVRTDDGVRLDFESGWVHLRSSNTEPIVRLIAEAQTSSEAEDLINQVSKFLS